MRQQQENGSGYRLILRPDRGQVELQRGAASFSRQVELDASRPISLQAFVQGSILECFVNANALTCRAYDHQQGRLGLAVTGGKAEVMDLKLNISPHSEQVASKSCVL
jgi:hypothetical protein